MNNHLVQPVLNLVRTQFLGLIAVLLVLTGSAAYAAAAKDSVTSRSIKNGAVKTVDLKNNAVTGDKVDESTLATVPDAASLGGLGAGSYAKSSVYKIEAATDAGQVLGDGTFTKFMACNAGDILLSGGPASLSSTSDLIESFPTPGSTNSWSARVDKNGVADSWTVVILCLDQA